MLKKSRGMVTRRWRYVNGDTLGEAGDRRGIIRRDAINRVPTDFACYLRTDVYNPSVLSDEF